MKTLSFNDNQGLTVNYLTDIIDDNELFTVYSVLTAKNGIETVGLTDEVIRANYPFKIGLIYVLKDFMDWASSSDLSLIETSQENPDPIYLVDNRTSQYQEYDDVTDLFELTGTVTYTDGTTQVRKVIRNGYYCVDRTLPGGDFSQAEGVGWRNVVTHYSSGGSYRYGYRNGYYVVDGTLGAGTFLQAEGVGWRNLKAVATPSGDDIFRDGVRGARYIIDEQVDTVWVNKETH